MPMKERPRKRTTIRVGQRLKRWDGERGYVDMNSQGKRVYGPGEAFKVIWVDADSSQLLVEHDFGIG